MKTTGNLLAKAEIRKPSKPKSSRYEINLPSKAVLIYRDVLQSSVNKNVSRKVSATVLYQFGVNKLHRCKDLALFRFIKKFL